MYTKNRVWTMLNLVDIIVIFGKFESSTGITDHLVPNNIDILLNLLFQKC